MKSLQGQLLIASPKLFDPNFFRSVVLLVQHTDAGALGLVLNRPLDMSIANAWEQVSDMPCEASGFLHQGGPCEGPLMVLHTDESIPEMPVIPEVFFTTDRDAIQQLVTQNQSKMKFFVGYAGWSPGQLESELEDGGWLITPAANKHIFEEEEDLWPTLMKEISEAIYQNLNPKVIPIDPSMN
ncbi:MAG TPA: YqgE/AlgH family protein [Tepidisphaeraceae bacterium]|jgi:putative transcriptional regulator|nr:YqgE/AlgH family protein [Tepidisphaeraceae bacterium]